PIAASATFSLSLSLSFSVTPRTQLEQQRLGRRGERIMNRLGTKSTRKGLNRRPWRASGGGSAASSAATSAWCSASLSACVIASYKASQIGMSGECELGTGWLLTDQERRKTG